MSDDRCRNCGEPYDTTAWDHYIDPSTSRYLCAWAEERTNA